MVEYCVEYRWRESIAHPYSRFYIRTDVPFKDKEAALKVAKNSSFPCRVVKQNRQTIKIFNKEKS